MKNATYLGKLHTRWISYHRPIRLCVPSIPDQLRVPYPEVLIWLFPLWEDGDDRSQVPAICRVFQVFLEDFKHFFRGSHVTSVEYLVRKSFVRVSDGTIWLAGFHDAIRATPELAYVWPYPTQGKKRFFSWAGYGYT